MKFSLSLILPCFLTVGAVSLASTVTANETASPQPGRTSLISNAESPNGTAHRGSGRCLANASIPETATSMTTNGAIG